MARSPIYLEVKDSAGNAVASPTINVKNRSDGSNATLFLAETGVTTMANPATGDSLGRLLTWVERGTFNCFVTGTGISPYTIPVDTTSDATLSIPGVPIQVQDVGQSGQVSAGRDLVLADFATLASLPTVPVGLFNLGGLTNLGTGGALTNKGSVGFTTGIGGAAASSAFFTNSTSQGLWIADTGAADPFRIKTGSVGCWFRTWTRTGLQALISKVRTSAAGYILSTSNGVAGTGSFAIYDAAGAVIGEAAGATPVLDGRWHHMVGTFDGTTLRLYVDGAQDGISSSSLSGAILHGAFPFNIGAFGADAGTAGTSPAGGPIDEAFVTTDVLTIDQVRLLYAAEIAHGYGRAPSRGTLAIRRARRGAPIVTADLPSTPLRNYNFTSGALTDAGSNNVALTVSGAAAPGAGADGTPGGGYAFPGSAAAYLVCSDAGLPSGTSARSLVCWVKTIQGVNSGTILAYGNSGAEQILLCSGGVLTVVEGGVTYPGVWISDGNWHHVALTVDPSATDLNLRKLYVDGRLVMSSTTAVGSITLAGAAGFRLGANTAGAVLLQGSIDGVIVHSVALTHDQVVKLYNKPAQLLGQSPIDATQYIEAMDDTNVYVALDYNVTSVDSVEGTVTS